MYINLYCLVLLPLVLTMAEQQEENKAPFGDQPDEEHKEQKADGTFDEKARIPLLESADVVAKANESQKLMSCARLVRGT